MDSVWMNTVIITSVFLLSGTCTPAETQLRLGISLGSYHIGSTEEFNEFNPGANISITFKTENRLQYGFQFGGYSNSYSERTLYGLAFVNYRIKKYEEAELFIGGFSGLFEYPNLIEQARSTGIPTLGNMVYIAGPSLTYQLENGVDLTLAYIPFQGKKTNGILTLQTSIPFGGPSY